MESQLLARPEEMKVSNESCFSVFCSKQDAFDLFSLVRRLRLKTNTIVLVLKLIEELDLYPFYVRRFCLRV